MGAPIYQGGPPFFKPWIRSGTKTGLTALAGGGQSGATPITRGLSTFTTVANAGDSAMLPNTVVGSGGKPVGARGAQIQVINLGANAMTVYPVSGDKINGVTNGGVSVAPNTVVTFYAPSANNWYVEGPGATAQSQPSNPTGTASTTMVMMGLAGAITPNATGRVLLTISGDVAQSTTADGAKWQLSYGTGAAPANAAALTGTQVGSNPTMTFLTGVLLVPFSSQALITGLTLGTAYWLDMALAAVTGGTATMTNLSLTAVEL